MVKPRSKKPVVLIVVAALVAAPALLWLFRGAIATSMARDEMAARGLTCDERFAVELAPLFTSATVGPTRCTREAGILEAIELRGPMRVTLEGTEPTAIDLSSVRLTLRESQVRGGTGWASALARLDLEQRVAALLKGVSELTTLDLPPATAQTAEVTQGGAGLARATDVTLTPGDARTELVMAQVQLGGARLVAVELSNVTGNATPSSVHLAGRGLARAGIPILGSLERGGSFALSVTALDSDSPRFAFDGRF